MIITLLIVLRRWTRSRCRDRSATLRVTSAMGVRVALPTGMHAQSALHAACVLQQGAPLHTAISRHSDGFVCSCLQCWWQRL